MIGIPLSARVQMKSDQKRTQNGHLESWVLCGLHIFNVTSILPIKLSRQYKMERKRFL